MMMIMIIIITVIVPMTTADLYREGHQVRRSALQGLARKGRIGEGRHHEVGIRGTAAALTVPVRVRLPAAMSHGVEVTSGVAGQTGHLHLAGHILRRDGA